MKSKTTFTLSEEDQKRINSFIKKQGEAYSGSIGGRFSYIFTPTSIGVVFKVVDTIKKEELNLTDYDSW